MKEYYFGSDAQRRMQRTAYWLWPLLRHDPNYCYTGRFVGVDAPNGDSVDALVALAHVQGATLANFVPVAREAELIAAFRQRGMRTDRWDQLVGEGCDAAAACVQSHPPPSGLHRVDLGPDTDEAVLDAMGATADLCGVNPPAGQVLRGEAGRGLAIVLQAEDGAVAACAGAVLGRHPASAYADTAWWGMLATASAYRGRHLASYLGALCMLAMNERYGVRRFYTGVRRENPLSRHICETLGLRESGLASVAALDRAAFGETALTR